MPPPPLSSAVTATNLVTSSGTVQSFETSNLAVETLVGIGVPMVLTEAALATPTEPLETLTGIPVPLAPNLNAVGRRFHPPVEPLMRKLCLERNGSGVPPVHVGLCLI